MAAYVGLRTSMGLSRPMLNFLRPCIPVKLFGQSSGVDLPQAPRRPPTSYMKFYLDKRDVIISSNPGVKQGEIAKICGDLWRRLPENEKEVYKLEFEEAIKIYFEEKRNYRDLLTDEQKQQLEVQREQRKKQLAKKKKRKLESSLKKPVGHMNAYSMFVKRRLPQRGDAPMKDYWRQMAQEWHDLSGTEKEHYRSEALAINRRRQEDLLDWEETMIATGHPELVRGYKEPQPQKQGKKRTKSKTASAHTKEKAKNTKAKAKSGVKKKSKPRKQPDTDPDPSWMREE